MSFLDNLFPLGMTHPLNRLEERVFCDNNGIVTLSGGRKTHCALQLLVDSHT